MFMMRYWNDWYAKHPAWFENQPWRPKSYHVPGCAGDKNHECFRKFEKWYKRPEKSHKLYWRFHKGI